MSRKDKFSYDYNSEEDQAEKGKEGSDSPGEDKPVSKASSDKPKKSGNGGKFAMFAGALIVGIIIGALAGTSMTANVTAGDSSSATITAQKASEKLVDFMKSRLEPSYPGITVEATGAQPSSDFSGMYEITVKMSFQGQDQSAPYFVSNDGNYMLSGKVNLNEELPAITNTPTSTGTAGTGTGTAGTGIAKAERPKVELFIWSYCPYGVQAQGPMAEVAKLLGEYADFETVLFHDGHGPHEAQENKIEACIQEVEPDKYWDYSQAFLDMVYPVCSSQRSVDCDTTESRKAMESVGIDADAIMSCVDERGAELIADHSARAGQNGVTGSPTIIINGNKVNVARNAEAIKAAVCESFTDPPEVCGTVLSADSAAAAGNC